MRIGSWHNPDDREAISRDLLVIAAIVLPALAFSALLPTIGLAGASCFLALLILGGGAALAFLRWRGPLGPGEAVSTRPSLHPGISAHRIPVAGGPGFLFAAGMVVMFWSGVPSYRPLVVLAVVLGSLLAVGLIQWRRP